MKRKRNLEKKSSCSMRSALHILTDPRMPKVRWKTKEKKRRKQNKNGATDNREQRTFLNINFLQIVLSETEDEEKEKEEQNRTRTEQ